MQVKVNKDSIKNYKRKEIEHENVKCINVEDKDRESSCNASDMSLEEPQTCLQLDELSESKDSEIDSVKSGSSSEFSRRNAISNEKGEDMKNEGNVIEHEKEDDKTENNEISAIEHNPHGLCNAVLLRKLLAVENELMSMKKKMLELKKRNQSQCQEIKCSMNEKEKLKKNPKK